MRHFEFTLSHLCFSWPQGREILRDLDGTFRLEGVTALCGPNGCGKSTFLALLAGELVPTSGRIRHGDGQIALERQRLDSTRSSPGQAQFSRLGHALRDDDAVLLLDEPTNHLDTGSLAELERRLVRRRSPTILVCHDRDLLDRIARRTLWLEHGSLVATDGGFSNAWRERELGMAKTLALRESRDARIRQVSSRLRSANEASRSANRDRTAGRRMKNPGDRDATSMAADFKFRTAQTSLGRNLSRLRNELDRLESGPSIEVRRDTLREIAFPWNEELASRRLSLAAGDVPAPDGTRIVHGGISLDGRSRVRLDGPNGAGKTTLMTALASQNRLGTAYLPQESSLEQDMEFLAKLRESDPAHLGRILSLAAALGASGKALRETASPSPGESRKLRLAAALASPAWMLLLDEPTNHLDAASIQRLQNALERWPGGLVIVTHDQRLSQLATTTWTLQDGRLVQA